ncbi:myo-inosose-2 dehydratase [Agrobacterium genomosp. 13]|uniref:Inosose dehydratase (2-keto-myo-inositol dehydratase) n=1 Tax=Agrobacterium genomosp. 13 str. CFBP 6927 TaxID=1183428 RepID=A0ABM9VCQ8_9HYPH|nr:myo-inosose-2 dehydratase [Agrobacterium genomosp. 13]CUX13860.1 putative inosose dehydratase (2-keto-myo-inositol dehydratase) [Agrobacterium genomosp. 13 str. CFBP 6927]
MSENTTLPQSKARLAVSPLSWANDVLEDLGADISLETCVSEAASNGYAGIELGRKFPRDVSILRPLLENHGLALASGWHSGQLAERTVEDEMASVVEHAELLKAMGCGVLVYGEVAMMTPGAPLDAPMSHRLVMQATDRTGYAARLTDFGKRLFDRYGLKLAYHHHLMMIAETFDEISDIIGGAGPEAGLLLDTGHAAAAGFDYEKLIEHLGDRIVHIHLKDMRKAVREDVRTNDLSFNKGVRNGMFTVPGDGVVDFDPVVRFVKSTGYDGWLVVEAEQDPVVAPPKEYTARAFEFIQTKFEGWSSEAG